MFGKEGTTEAQGAINTILGHDCKFTGNIDAKGSVRIDGDFEGKVVSSDSVIVGKGGMVRGEIHAAHAVVSGNVEGNVFAKKKVELEGGAKLIGDVESVSLVIEDGVFFEGRSKMKREGEGFVPPKPKIIKDVQESKI
jgi:cytoskeletal protein CcmA (bactofilin family)